MPADPPAPPEPPPGRFSPKPPWLKVRAPGGENYARLKGTFRKLDLFTVCEEARCPNVGECWSEGTATVMLLGDTCTRACRFCAVKTGHPGGAVDVREPDHVARALSKQGLQYVVLTMVDRDDLLDGGAAHVARTVRLIKEFRPDMLVETLLGDFAGKRDAIFAVVDAAPDVFAHNIEVVERLQRTIRDVRSGYARSMEVLALAKKRAPERLTKSSIMVGIGETDDEVRQTMADLRSAGVDLLTLGQYLRPTPKHAKVDRYVDPETFAKYATWGNELGFAYVASGPLVRSSYKAAEVFVKSVLLPGNPDGAKALLSARLEQAKRAASDVRESLGEHGTPLRSTSELAAREVRNLVPLSRLVREDG